MGQIVFDRSHYPIIVARVEGVPSDDDITEYLNGLGEILREKSRGVLVVDGTRAQPSSQTQRKRIGEWMRAHKSEMAARGVGCAFVFPGTIYRFVLSSIFLIQRPPMPYVVVATLDEALTWARGQLAQLRA